MVATCALLLWSQNSMDFTYDFQPRQIVCLEHEATCLYAEVIQVVESRQVCWVRPLLLKDPSCNYPPLEPLLYDLRPSADLLWPLTLFRPALDTEVLPLLVQLMASEPQTEREPVAQQQFNQFIRQVWQFHLERGEGRGDFGF
ncbi:hypothetical protein [Chroococcidiopsis sp. CCMEE 29]|uniref:hypothetical protein n=1 Tax=Chroococcidiopsis sp. CCMEE 29 TaxID=155894 RepID=UPI00201FE4B8|nr:hypothetical protein [Chroococcidiopsis sp. CCMEE 29]